MRRFEGFTMIEMLFVIVIIGIGMSIAVPSFQGMLQRNRLATQANDLTMAINLARSEASRIGNIVSLQALVGTAGNEFGGGYCLITDNPGDCTDDADNTVIRRFPALTGGATLEGVDDAPNSGDWDSPRTSIQFNGRGGLSGTSNQVRYLDLCLDGQLGRRIQLALIGRPKVWREAEPGDPVPSVQPDC
ncbi:MAG: prepilin-type N-terminal cleavage/methylation domain-containing protein [Gammaproteobacteria bacterium]|nr:prepilin-type N-terminal cleavage/methylation domain-containing protein [Gammaproteobacteria bacterium]MBT5792811.1 prepilin-type N-terminal cleavage/methylation domain-containing protein [Gammaproteobacteria bacterium]MBT7173722.1 prepilin-type N-terminal cleavage/methylation domain-containing protein [Gammaproteobacteria bacterium]